MSAVDTARTGSGGPGSGGAESGAPTTLLARVRRAGSKQLLTMSGQLVAGVGNMIISALFARVLLPGEYAVLVSFVSAYVLMHMVGSSVTAAVAIDPGLHKRLFRRGLALGLGVGAILAALSGVLSPLLNLPVPVIILLGAAGPSAVLLALARGRLYGTQSVGGTVATLITEPIGRAVIGLLLGSVIGPVGAAVGVVAAGYAALAAASIAARRGPDVLPQVAEDTGRHARRARTGDSLYVTITFLLVACLASANAIFSNRQLGPGEAGVFAAVATIGSAAYFATGTIPMMLSGSRDSGRSSLLVAVGVAGAVSLAGVGVVALLPARAYAMVLGEHYASVGDYVVAYVAAMAALGIGRVLIAQLCKTGLARAAAVLSALSVAVQVGVLIPAHSASAVVAATAAGCGMLLVGSAVVLLREARLQRAMVVVDPEASRTAVRPAAAPAPAAPPVVQRVPLGSRIKGLWPLWLAMALGIGLRVVVTRSIWVDEAISIQQAQLPYPDMINTLKNDDVHPPLFHTILWALVHLTGSTAEYIVRLPSLLAGTACIPISYAMAKDLWNRRTAVVAGFVVAVAPVAVWYSQEARMYGLWMLGATILAWCQIRILRDIKQGKGYGSLADWAGFTVVTAAMIYVQWFTALPIITQHLIFLIAVLKVRKWRFVRNWLLSAVVQLILFAPLVPYMLDQFGNIIAAQGASTAPSQTGSDTATTGKPDVYAAVANTIWSVWGYHADSTMVQLGAFWPVAVLMCFAALGRVRDRTNLILATIAVAPPAMLFLVGFERRQFFELRYFDSTVPMLLLVLARMAATWGRGPLTKLLLPVVTIASLGAGLVDQQINQSNPRVYDFRGAVSWVKANSQPQDVVLYAPNFLRTELEYYPSGLTTLDANSAHPSRPQTGMPAIPKQGRRVFVFGSFLEEPQVAGQVGGVLSDLDRASNTKRLAVHSVANVKVWEYQQLPPSKSGTSKTDTKQTKGGK